MWRTHRRRVPAGWAGAIEEARHDSLPGNRRSLGRGTPYPPCCSPASSTLKKSSRPNRSFRQAPELAPMARLLADENVPGRLVESLRGRGHDVRWARTDARGSPDQDLLALAQAEARVVLTMDKDFGTPRVSPEAARPPQSGLPPLGAPPAAEARAHRAGCPRTRRSPAGQVHGGRRRTCADDSATVAAGVDRPTASASPVIPSPSPPPR